MRLSLAYRNPACVRVLPPCLTFEARSAPYSVVMKADAAIHGNIWGQHVLAALRALNVPLTAPNTPLTHRLLFSSGDPQHTVWGPGRPSARKQSIPTATSCTTQRRCYHKDSHANTKCNQTEKPTQQSQQLFAICDPALRPDNLPNLFSFNWCFDPTNKKKRKNAQKNQHQQ